MTKEREFYVDQRQTGVQTWHVVAKSKAEAIRKIRAGEGTAVAFEIVRTGSYTAEEST